MAAHRSAVPVTGQSAAVMTADGVAQVAAVRSAVPVTGQSAAVMTADGVAQVAAVRSAVPVTGQSAAATKLAAATTTDGVAAPLSTLMQRNVHQ